MPYLFISTVPPRLGALSFPENTRFGIRTQVTCFVQEGDLPIEIHWQKDGQRLKKIITFSIEQIYNVISYQEHFIIKIQHSYFS